MQSYHGEEVVDAINGSGFLSDFLVKTVTQVVSRISRDDQCFFVLRQQSGQTAASCGFTDSSFASHEDPVEGSLLDDVSEMTRVLGLHYKSV
jgi:hypothetical protein